MVVFANRFFFSLVPFPFKFNVLENFVTLRPLTLFQPKIRTTKLQKKTKKKLKFVLLDNYFPDLFTEVQIGY